MPSKTLVTSPVYGLASPPQRFAPYQRAIIGYGPTIYVPCDETSAATVLSDAFGRYRLSKVSTPSPGQTPIATGSLHSARVTSGTAWSLGATLAISTTFTYGMIYRDEGSGTDGGGWCQWNGAGQGFLVQSGNMRMYVGGTFINGGSNTQTHFWVGTYDGTSIRIYRDGALTGGPTAAGSSGATGALGINLYSGTARQCQAKVSDCFVLSGIVLSATQIAALAALITV